MTPLKKKPISRQRKSAKPSSISSPQVKTDPEENQIKLELAFPAAEGPRFGSSFLELARDCELPLGTRGALMLSQLRHLEEANDLFRRRYRHQLSEQPNSVLGWELSHTQMREIPNTLRAFSLVANQPHLRDAFLDACKIKISELQKTLGAVLGLPAEDAHVYIERVFSEVLASREVARLVQVKGFKAWEQERRLGGGEA